MKFLSHTILLFAGLAGGYFGNTLLSAKPKPTINKAAISTKSIPTKYSDAREFSLRYRKNAKVGYCPVPTSKYIAIPASQLGFMRLSYDNITDLKGAVDAIRAEQIKVSGSHVSTEFRLIYGMNTQDKVCLLVAPLNSVGKEIQTVAGKNVIHQLAYGIDCPIQCDIDFARSEIITGKYLNAPPDDESYAGSCN